MKKTQAKGSRDGASGTTKTATVSTKLDKDGLTKQQREDYIRKAKQQYESEGFIEIDDNAKLSVGMDKGVYVEAWVWVSDEKEDEIPYG
jgi:hypothetical protein